MELENVSAEIRPRSDWEAIDLGISLVREHIGAIVRVWSVTVFPICAIILAVSAPFSLFWGLFLIWWLKPLFERVVLFYLSRALFGENPTTGQVFRAFPRMVGASWPLALIGFFIAFSGWFVWDKEGMEGMRVLHFLFVGACLFYRSMPNRALSLPVRMLENLGGKSARARLQVLGRRGTASVALMALCIILEAGLLLSLLYLMVMFVPTETMVDWEVYLDDLWEGEGALLPAGMGWLLGVLYFIAMSLTAWFYIGGGFALYLNARTWIEGWDVELEFKRIGKRFSTTAALLLVCAFSVFSQGQVRADEKLDEIVASEDFKIEKKETRHWVSDKKNSRGGSSAGLFVQAFGQILFWALVTLAIVGLVWLIYRNRHLFERGTGAPKPGKKRQPQTLRGMNLTPESLPEDILAASRQAWAAGDAHLALSLLYRGAISDLLERDLVQIGESATEADCLRQVRATAGQVAGYFEILTGAWVNLAYGKRGPGEERIARLWSEWPFSGNGGTAA